MSIIRNIKDWWTLLLCPSEFLCDNCQLDHPSTCAHTARPNATKCPDYKPK